MNDDTAIGTLFNEPSTRDLVRHNERMNGEQLYEVWAKAMANRKVSVDPWDDLADEDQASWEEVANVVNANGPMAAR